mgnify:CR=1 FL=1
MPAYSLCLLCPARRQKDKNKDAAQCGAPAFEMEGKVMQVVEFQHVKPGKGAAFVRTKMRNVITGSVTETSFNPTAKFERAAHEGPALIPCSAPDTRRCGCRCGYGPRD